MRTCFRSGLVSLGLLVAVTMLTGCQSAGYYAQAVRGHLQIVHRQQPIAELLQQPQPPEPLKAKLRLVLALREFAAQELKLPVNGHYLRYADLGRSNVVWNVTATPEFSMTPKDWWYPVVGRLAYRGYFVEDAARRQAAKLGRCHKGRWRCGEGGGGGDWRSPVEVRPRNRIFAAKGRREHKGKRFKFQAG